MFEWAFDNLFAVRLKFNDKKHKTWLAEIKTNIYDVYSTWR